MPPFPLTTTGVAMPSGLQGNIFKEVEFVSYVHTNVFVYIIHICYV